MRRRSFKLILSLFIWPWALIGCALGDDPQAVPEYSLDLFAWQRGWKYPIEQLPENMRLATTTLGPLVVKEGQFKHSVPENLKPWASWWYPSKEKTLFDGAKSPLKKFDQLRKTLLNKNSTTAATTQERWSSSAVAWEGLCDSWSLASVYEYEPITHLRIGDTCLTPGDQRALLISSYKAQGGDLKNNFFGQLNRNGANDIFADIYPDQLHLVVQKQLAERQSAFLIDTDPGVEVWTVPIYQAEITVQRVANSADTVSVTLMLTYPEFQYTEQDRLAFDSKSYGPQFVKRQYTYNLYGTWVGDEFKVDGGEWTGTSERNHPDYAIVLPQKNSVMMAAKPEFQGPQFVEYSDLMNLLNQGQPVSNCK